jgi:hypothetical protein
MAQSFAQSHLTPHTSHLTPHTSHLTPHTSHLTPQARLASVSHRLLRLSRDGRHPAAPPLSLASSNSQDDANSGGSGNSSMMQLSSLDDADNPPPLTMIGSAFTGAAGSASLLSRLTGVEASSYEHHFIPLQIIVTFFSVTRRRRL